MEESTKKEAQKELDKKKLPNSSILSDLFTKRGSKQHQAELERGAPIIQKVVDLLEGDSQQLGMLMLDEYGNYFMQKLFSVCEPNQISLLLKTLSPQTFLHVAQHPRGTHSLQKLINFAKNEEDKVCLTKLVESRVIALALN